VSDRHRAIVHIDLDAFYAAVEMLENTDLRDKALIIGGRHRGVVTTASYKARESGVRSAMPMFQALRLCPDAVVLPPRHHRYRQASQRVMAILRRFTRQMEQVSIDEAYLDLTEEIKDWDGAVEIAGQIQAQIMAEEKLPSSLGVATNKLVAKVASDQDKPQGLTVVRPGEESAFLAPLPVRVLWGVGPVTAAKLAEIGVKTVGELTSKSEDELQARFGRHGAAMARQARGMDNRLVVREREAKSVSQETTFRHDLSDAEALEGHLLRLCEGVARRLKRSQMAAGTVAIKLRYADFTTLTRQMTLAVPTDDEKVIHRTALALFHRVWREGQPVRLLGVAGRHLSPPGGQLPLL
jgi:DNA polymerase-4